MVIKCHTHFGDVEFLYGFIIGQNTFEISRQKKRICSNEGMDLKFGTHYHDIK